MYIYICINYIKIGISFEYTVNLVGSQRILADVDVVMSTGPARCMYTEHT